MTLNRIVTSDDNIALISELYPDGLHFVVGDVHGEAKTLENLMEKVSFDPDKDHVFLLETIIDSVK